jgi:hypothetical protein
MRSRIHVSYEEQDTSVMMPLGWYDDHIGGGGRLLLLHTRVG